MTRGIHTLNWISTVVQVSHESNWRQVVAGSKIIAVPLVMLTLEWCLMSTLSYSYMVFCFTTAIIENALIKLQFTLFAEIWIRDHYRKI